MASYTVSILRHDQTSELLHFTQSKVLIGREAGDIVTGDAMVSTQHAELSFENGTLTYSDLGSTNGTFRPDGKRVASPLVLSPGTALRLGNTTITVQAIEAVQTGPQGTQVMPQDGEAFPKEPAHDARYTSEPAAHATAADSGATNPTGGPTAAPGEATGTAAEVEQRIERLASPGSASDGLLDQAKYFLAEAAKLYKRHYVNGALTMGLVMVPGAVISVAFGWIPLLGSIVAVLVSLVELALAPIAAGAMGRWALATAVGKSMTWQQAWRAALKNPVSEWLNIAVASFVIALGTLLLVIPGIIVGMFALPAYLLEDKRLFSINMRSADLVMKDMGRHLGLGILAILAMVPAMLLVAIFAAILGFIPFVGPPLASLLTVAVTVVVLPFVYLVWSLVYFDARKRFEGVDARSSEAPRIQDWTGSTN